MFPWLSEMAIFVSTERVSLVVSVPRQNSIQRIFVDGYSLESTSSGKAEPNAACGWHAYEPSFA